MGMLNYSLLVDSFWLFKIEREIISVQNIAVCNVGFFFPDTWAQAYDVENSVVVNPNNQALKKLS